MTFEPARGDWVMKKIPTKASVTYTLGAFMYDDGTNMVPCVDATQVGALGIAQEAKSSSSTTTDIHVLCPSGVFSTFYGDMESGETLSRANVGAFFDFATGSGDNLGVTVSTASTYDTVQLVRYISSTKGEFRLNPTFGVEN